MGLFGRRGWWFIPAAAIGWPRLLIVPGIDDATYGIVVLSIGAAALGAINATIGVAVGHAARWSIGKVRSRTQRQTWAATRCRTWVAPSDLGLGGASYVCDEADDVTGRNQWRFA
jgi:hypothetical protein